MSNQKLLKQSNSVSFADVAHGMLQFDAETETGKLILELIDTPWMQRLRHISQTGNTKLVYMFAEHSRFGHSLGVAYLACSLMQRLKVFHYEQVAALEKAVAAASLLHDIGHLSPGSHLAEKVWSRKAKSAHEKISVRVILEDPAIGGILDRHGSGLKEQVAAILQGSADIAPWAVSIISGGGWNADRGNWAIVDSAMCAVSYGRYNVPALLDAFRISENAELILLESRLDALTHFFVARDSMYRQIYQHRVLQAVDAMTLKLVERLRELFLDKAEDHKKKAKSWADLNIFLDSSMQTLLEAESPAALPLKVLFNMTEHWWRYHLERWCEAEDSILRDLALRLRDRKLFKTVRLSENPEERENIITTAKALAEKHNLDPAYYLLQVSDSDAHRSKQEAPPMVLLDSGAVVPVTKVEPLIAQILAPTSSNRRWLACPSEIKSALGKIR